MADRNNGIALNFEKSCAISTSCFLKPVKSFFLLPFLNALVLLFTGGTTCMKLDKVNTNNKPEPDLCFTTITATAEELPSFNYLKRKMT